MALDDLTLDNETSEIYSGGLRMLTPIERSELEQYEEVIERGLETFMEVGTALIAIREKGLYEGQYRTFEEYCQQRWNFGARRARQLMAAARVVGNLHEAEEALPLMPQSSVQAEELARLREPEQQIEAWKRAIERSPEVYGQTKVSGTIVKEVVDEMLGKEPVRSDFDQGDRQQQSPEPLPVNNIRPGLQPLMTSDTPEWYTPRHIIKLVERVLGYIELDPCSNSRFHPNVPAYVNYDADDNGLTKQWRGKTYMNPPYGDEIKEWVAKLVEEYELGNVHEAIALLPARTDTAWMRMLSDYPRCYVWGRLKFSGSDNSAPFPSVLVYLGDDTDRFAEVFSEVGDIYVKWRG